MKKSNFRKVNEMNPASSGAAAAQQDSRAAKDKSQPFGYYSEQFWALEEVRQRVIDLQFKYRDKSAGGPNFKKAARLIEQAGNEMLKAGR